jgi:hypothetical protein
VPSPSTTSVSAVTPVSSTSPSLRLWSARS